MLTSILSTNILDKSFIFYPFYIMTVATPTSQATNTYRVYVESKETFYTDVQADTEAQAYELANDIDGNSFQPCFDGTWETKSAEQLS